MINDDDLKKPDNYIRITIEETAALIRHSVECRHPLSMAIGGGLKVSDDNIEYLIELGKMRGVDVSQYAGKHSVDGRA